MTKGKVKFFNPTKGFGFISPIDEEGNIIPDAKEAFVHISSLSEGMMLKENDIVQYNEEVGPKGINAVNLQLI